MKETSENKTKVENPPQNSNSDDDMSLDEVDGWRLHKKSIRKKKKNATYCEICSSKYKLRRNFKSTEI